MHQRRLIVLTRQWIAAAALVLALAACGSPTPTEPSVTTTPATQAAGTPSTSTPQPDRLQPSGERAWVSRAPGPALIGSLDTAATIWLPTCSLA
jgi:hypothetical protein